MKTNVLGTERLIRLILGVVLILVQYKFHVHVALLYVGGILGLTGLFGFCPLYAFFKKD